MDLIKYLDSENGREREREWINEGEEGGGNDKEKEQEFLFRIPIVKI